MRKKIENILHINCFDIYGLCEITGPGVAMDCIHHAGLHVNADHFYPEVLNPATNEACADGETGELVFTTLSKEAMPLLRYRTKDLTSIDHSRCACGRTTPRISKFTGRTDDMKVIRGVNVFPTQVETALLSMGGAVAPHYMMIVDREDNLDVLTVMVEVDESMFSDEIRKLADESKESTDEIKKIITEITEKSKLVESTMQENEVLQTEQQEAINRTEEIFGEIMKQIEMLGSGMERINALNDTMSANKDLVVDKMGTIASVSEQSAAATEEVNASTEQVNVTMEEISEHTETLQAIAKDLMETINRFKLA